jgi:septum formation protein
MGTASTADITASLLARKTMINIVLASASPARRALLTRAGLHFSVLVSGVEEESEEFDALTPPALAETLAGLKAAAVAKKTASPSLVIGCDSVFELEGKGFGKPLDPATAIERWQNMRGKTGTLHTGHCVIDTTSGRSSSATASTDVTFADISDAEISSYVASGEPLQVAGAFTIDSLGGPYIDWIHGDPSCVEGLSLPLLRRMVEELGYPWHQLRDREGAA